MNAADRRRLIQLAGHERDLATELNVTYDALDHWQRTGRGLQRQRVRLLSYLADLEERRVALAQSGVPVCEWMEGFAFPEDTSAEDHMRVARELEAHAAECPTCLRCQRFLDERFGPPTKPFGPLAGFFAGIAGLIMGVPRGLRPAAVGAVLIGGIVGVRSLFALPLLLGSGNWQTVLSQLVVTLAAAAGAGASGGLLYSLTRPAAQLLGPAADYVSGVASVAGYLAGMVMLGPYAFGEEIFPIDDPSDVWTLVGLSLLFGLIVGHALRKAR